MRHAAPATTASLLEAQGRIWRVALNVDRRPRPTEDR